MKIFTLPTIWQLRGFILLLAMFTELTMQAATLEVSSPTLNASNNQRKITFNITSDADWNISENIDWLSSDNTSSTGNKTITLNLDPNKTTTSRTGILTITCTGASPKTINITQEGVLADAFENNDSEETAFNVNLAFNNDVAIFYIDEATIHSITDVDYFKLSLAAGYTYTAEVDFYGEDWAPNNSHPYSINVDYSYKINTDDWKSTRYAYLSLNAGNHLFKVKARNNEDLGAYGIKLTITRGLGTPTLSIPTIFNNFSNDAGSKDITISSNTNWNIKREDPFASWFSLSSTSGSKDGTVTISVEKNTRIRYNAVTLFLFGNGALPVPILIRQSAKTFPDDNYEANETESTAKELPVNFTNNMANILTNGAQISNETDNDYYKIFLPTGYTYAISAFLHDSINGKEFLDGSIEYKIGADPWSYNSFDNKIPDFSFSGGNYIYFKVRPVNSGNTGKYILDLSIVQNSVAPTLSVSKTNLPLGADDNSTNTFNITSTSGWKISVDQPWLTVSPSSGWGNETVTVTGLANVGSSTRTANLTINCPTLPSQSITVSQDEDGSLLADSYEPNDTEESATELTAVFIDDKAHVVTTGSNIHTINDDDYYKVYLPAGYTYTVIFKMYENYDPRNSTNLYNNGEYYSLANARYNLKGTDGNWISFCNKCEYTFTGGGYIYFLVAPYNPPQKGTYPLEINITRALGTPTLYVPTNTITLSADAGSSENIDITSSGTTWKVSTSEPWLTASFNTGTGDATISLNAKSNGNLYSRGAWVIVSGNGVASKWINVSQSGSDLDPDIYEQNNTENTAYEAIIEYNNNTGSFCTFNANINSLSDIDYYKINLPEGYSYTISPLIDYNYYYINQQVSYKSGSNGSWSSAYSGSVPPITIRGGTDVYFKVESIHSYKGYYDMYVYIERKPVSLSLSQTSYNFTKAQTTETFNITSDIDWTVTSSQTWLTVTPASGSNDGSVTLTASANTGVNARHATITVTGNGITKSITVTQSGIAPVLTVSNETLNANAAANSTATFDITSNTSWTATSSETWLTVGTALGTGNTNITLTASANESVSTRTATITVTGSNITRTITVTQAGAAPVLTVSKTTVTINAPANSTATFDITSNTSWTVTSSEAWLTLSSASGSNNAAITLTAAANETTTTRTVTVTVTGSGITKTVAVTQTGKSMGTNDVEVSDGIKFYPNPVMDKLTIELEGKSVENRVMIYSEKGELKSDKTYNASNFDIEMSNLGAGVYFIKIVNAKESKTIKIVKKN